MEIAIFGGTFDPPTKAHEAIMAGLLDQPDIEQVWVMPSGVRDDKQGMGSDAVRMEMLQLIQRERFAANPRLVVSDFELELPRPTRTYQTVDALQANHPNDHFWFVFGADSIETMHAWMHGERLQKCLGMIAIPRAGHELPAPAPNIRYLDVQLGISSSQVRAAVEAGEPIAPMVSPAIEAFVRMAGLYVQPVAVQ